MNYVSYFWNTNIQPDNEGVNEVILVDQFKVSDIKLCQVKPIVVAQNTANFDQVTFDQIQNENKQSQMFFPEKKINKINSNLQELQEFRKCSNVDIGIKQEKLDQLNKLYQDLNTLKIIHEDLLAIVGEQTQTIKEIDQNIVQTNEVIELSNLELLDADQYKIEYTGTKLTVSTVSSTVVGTVAFVAGGWKIGLVLGVAALLGGTAWAVLPS